MGKTYTFTTATYTALGTGTGTPSTASGTVTIPDPPVNATAPVITGTGGEYAVGTPVTASDGTWTGDTITGYAYQWQSCTSADDTTTCSDITGAITSSYTPVSGDAGRFLRIGVTATNQYGSAIAYSIPTAAQQITEQPAFASASPPTIADVNRPYGTYRFTASGYRVTYSEDSAGLTGLPAGMSVDDTGDLTGTPTVRGVFTYRVKATNDAGSVLTDTLTLTVSSGVASTVAITQQPVGGPSRGLLTTQPIVQVLDDSGLPVRDDTISVTSTGSIGGSQASGLATVNGVATFTNLTLGGLVNTDYTLTFTADSDPTAVITSAPTQVTPGLATTLILVTAPQAAPEAGAVMTTQPVVNLEDADGNLVTYDDTTIVTLTPETGGFVGPTQASVATATASGGVATFSGVRFGGPVGVAKTLTFTADRDNVGPALTDDSASVTSTATGPAYKLVVTTQATSPSASGAAFTQQPAVERQDMAGNAVTADPQAQVTATLVEESLPYDVLVGDVTEPTVAGVATYTDLGISGLAGSTYTMRFTSPGLVSADDTVVPSAGTASRLSLTAPNAAVAGDASYDDTAFNPQPKVQIVDSGNNPTSIAGIEITASLVLGTGTLYDDTAITDANGLATFAGLALDGLVGTYVLEFSATGYASIDDTVRMLRGAQTVTLNPISTKTVGDAPFAISATTSSGLRATFSTTTPSVCAVAGNQTVVDDTTGGSVSILGGGSCTIVASQGGNASFEPASDDSVTFTVNKAAQATLTVFADDTTATAGQTVQLSTLGGSGTGVVTYSEAADPGGICSVDTNTGGVTFTGTGNTCDVTATKAGDSDYNPTTSSAVTITVPGSPAGLTGQTIGFTSTSPASPVDDDTYVVSAEATSGLAVTIAVQSGSPAVCTATTGSSPVTVTFTGAGTCVLEATQTGDARFAAAAPVVQTLLVYATASEAASGVRNQSITFPVPADRRIGSADFRLVATASSDLPVAFTSSTSAVCTVTPGGIVHLVSTGTCTIEADQTGNLSFAAADPVTRSFTVTAGVPAAPRITSVSAGSGAATIAFSAPASDGGSAILGYTVRAIPTVSGTTVMSNACTASPCTIGGLTDGVEYTVQIAAVNAVGSGVYSSSSTAITPKTCTLCVGAPGAPGTPGGPEGELIDDTTVTLTWSQPTALGDDTFVAYDIYYREAGTAWPATPQVTIASIGTTTTTITGLTPRVVYEYLIVVVTVANPRVSPPDPDAPSATPIIVSVPTAPMAPTDLAALYVSDTSIVVSWGYSPNDGGSPVIGYTTTLSAGASCAPVVLDDTTATATCSASGLITGTTYTISVTASNAVGTSSASAITYTTPGVAPGPTPDPGPQPLPPAPPMPPAPQPLPDNPLPPGATEGTENGRPIGVTPGTNSPGDQLTVTGPNFSLTVTAFDTNHRPITLGEGMVLRTTPGGRIVVTGGVYSFKSDVSAYLFTDAGGAAPKSAKEQESRGLVAQAFAVTSAQGRFTITLNVPEEVPTGSYVLQVNGYSLLAATRSVNIGVVVEAMPWISAAKAGGRAIQGRMVVSAHSGDIPAGTRVIPMIKLKGQGGFKPGSARPRVQEDGTFTWHRDIGKCKKQNMDRCTKAWVYFVFDVPGTIRPSEVRSNTLAYLRGDRPGY